MAEILLSLTIIGVVAAITLPSLTGNINERTWNTQRKALYARISQAISLMPALNGYGEYIGTNIDDVVNVEKDTAAETFVTNGLSKVIKINNICDSEHLADCGITTSYTNLAGSRKTFPTKLSELNSRFTDRYFGTDTEGSGWTNPQNNIDTKAAAFETANGESIAVFYNPSCTLHIVDTTNWHYAQPKMCANFIYDLNGSKGPNTVGKDIGFITALYPTDSIVVAPMPIGADFLEATQLNASKACTDKNPDSRVPNLEELSSMFYNKELIGITGSGYFWTSSVLTSNKDKAWAIQFGIGYRSSGNRSGGGCVHCIKR